MVNTKDFSEEKVENRNREDKLPKTDEVQAEGDAAKHEVLLYGADDSLGYILGLEDGDNGRFYSIKHARIDVIRCDGGDTYWTFLLLQFSSYKILQEPSCLFHTFHHQMHRSARDNRLQ